MAYCPQISVDLSFGLRTMLKSSILVAGTQAEEISTIASTPSLLSEYGEAPVRVVHKGTSPFMAGNETPDQV